MCRSHGYLTWVGSTEGDISRLEASSSASVCCNHQNKNSKCNDMICNSDGLNSEQLVRAKKLGVLERSPADEVEGEIIYFQHRLLGNAVARKHFTGLLFFSFDFFRIFWLLLLLIFSCF